ncbi:MAG TPA: HIT domain-containing protein [Gammaproteobacteria bacterium]|nr:HIT domain-containing protein [Gammaproteobacteria bacterium]
MTSSFELDPRLAADCIRVGRLPLSLLLLLNDARYPWFVLVPQRSDVSEVFQLSDDDQQQLWRESAQLARHLMQGFHADKINIGALGNLVPQLHVHHIARFSTDPAWPGPVWGHSAPEPYAKHGITERVGMACEWFGDALDVL